MRGPRRDSDDMGSAEELCVAAARFGLSVAGDAAAFRALASEAQSMSLDEWLAESRGVRGRVADCVIGMARDVGSALPADMAADVWAIGVAASALKLDADDAELLAEAMVERLRETS